MCPPCYVNSDEKGIKNVARIIVQDSNSKNKWLGLFLRFLRYTKICVPKMQYLMLCSQKPTLKKVSKYENKFAKLQKKAAEFNFRNQLKVVKKKEFTLEEEDKEVSVTTHSPVCLNWAGKIFCEQVTLSHLLELGNF
jgi:hypothetical protein